MRSLRAQLAVMGLLAMLGLSGTADAADKVKYGLLPVPHTVLVGIEKGFFKAEDIDVELVFFRSGAELVPSLSTGQIELAATSPGAALYNALGSGVDAMIVGDYFVPMPEGNGDPNGIAVRKELVDSGKFKGPADAKGLTIAITARGQFTDLFITQYLKTGGLTPADVRIVNMTYPDMLPALKSGAIDIGVTIDPFLAIAEQEGIATRVARISDVLPGLDLGVIMYGRKLARDDRTLGMRFMRAYAKSNDWAREARATPEGRAELQQIMNKYIPLQNPDLYKTMGLAFGRGDMLVDVGGPHGLKWQLEQYQKSGLIKNAPDLDKVVDNSFAKAAMEKAK